MSSTGAANVLSEMINQQSDTYKVKLFEEVEHWLFTQGRSSATTHINRAGDHPTEQKYPLQTKRFREILDEMYRVHLDKNNDYSKYNILGTGEIGICVRFWDKCARILHIMGFDIGTGEYTGRKKEMVIGESLEDSFIDSSNYGIIARIYLEGLWGK